MKKFLLLLLIFNILLFAEFKQRYYTNLIGNVKVIGNTVLDGPDNGLSNADIILKYTDIDNDNSTFNSSSATIESVLNGLNISKSKIKWAGLYWLGYLHNDEGKYYSKDNGLDNIFHFSKKSALESDKAIKKFLDNQSVYLKVDGGNYINIKPNKVYKYRFNYVNRYPQNYLNYVSYVYSAFADVTNILKDKSINHKYMVANIPTRSGMTRSGTWGDGLGNFSAWSLVLIYDNSKELDEKTRNITIYDGFETITGWVPALAKVKIDFSGFKTPTYAPNGVDSSIAIFAGEGDKYILGDGAILTNQDGYKYNLPFPSGTGSYFASSIDGVPNREPKISNNNGIDIHINKIGTKDGSDKPIKTNQNKASLTLYSKTTGNARDFYVPTMVAFSTELYEPNICYDYSLSLGDYIPIESKNRKFQVNKSKQPLKVKIMLRSKEADFDLIHSKMYIKFNPNDSFKYIIGSAEYTLPNINSYEKSIEIDKTNGTIAVGSNPDITGGTISAKERIYTIESFNINNDFNGTFDIYLDANISYDTHTNVNYLLSTKKKIARCPVNSIYNPVYGMFNIENKNATFSTPKEIRYSLPTQVAGKPYKVTIASYKKDTDNRYTLPNKIKTNMELELINAKSFENNNSADFDSVCEDPDTLATSMGGYIKFNNQDRIEAYIPQNFKNYPSNLALRNATFRVWLLTKRVDNKTVLVKQTCKNTYDSQCFDRIYKNYYKKDNSDKNLYCASSCKNSHNNECYLCLKKYFGKPVCARDNFAIKPKSYSISISDSNETDSNKKFIANNSNSKYIKIAAGYRYPIDINATYLNNGNKSTKGYYFKTNNTTNTSMLNFRDSSSCADKNSSIINLDILNGKSIEYNISNSTNKLVTKNSGKYALHILDSSWTQIDQKGYKYKPFPNVADCIKGSSSINKESLHGCNIESDKDLLIDSYPYSYDLNSVSFKSNPNTNANYTYINDLNTTAIITKDKTMSLLASGTIVAKSKDNRILTNYTKSCKANDLTLNYNFSYTPSANSILSLDYFLLDNNIKVVKNINNNSEIKFSKKYFKDENRGSANLNSYFNFTRSYNNPINPFSLNLNSITIKGIDKINANLSSAFIPTKVKNINSSKELYYAKVKSKQEVYDDIYDDDIETPITVNIFCNKSLDYCSKYGIDVSKSLTNEYDWWLALKHNSSKGDGDAILDIDTSKDSNAKNRVEVKPTLANNFVKAIDNNIKVAKKAGASIDYPYTAYIKPANSMVIKYPYLLFNKSANTPPAFLYKVKFVNSSAAWSGKGKTGFATDFNSTGRKSKKVDW